jgi:ribosomal protein S18 acetylase RimI-like enzyme
MTVILRDATLSDARGIAAVHVEGWQTTYRGLLPDSYLDSLTVEGRAEFWTRPLTTRPTGWHMLVAEDDEGIVGFACGSAEWGEPRPGCEGHVNAIYVRSDLRGRKIGTRLLAALFRKLAADGRQSISLWVLEGNDRSEAFYRDRGAKELMRAEKPGPVDPVREIALGWDKAAIERVIAMERP